MSTTCNRYGTKARSIVGLVCAVLSREESLEPCLELVGSSEQINRNCTEGPVWTDQGLDTNYFVGAAP